MAQTEHAASMNEAQISVEKTSIEDISTSTITSKKSKRREKKSGAQKTIHDTKEGISTSSVPTNTRKSPNGDSQSETSRRTKRGTNPKGCNRSCIPSGPDSQTSSTPAEVKNPPIPTSLTATAATARLFIASLGNPPPHATTRHSAGHIMIKSLQSTQGLPAFKKSKTHANGLTLPGFSKAGHPEFTLWQSPSQMNVSGTALLKAYRSFAAATSTTELPTLVVLYDEMEVAPGQLSVRRGATSAKGHNGLKSVQQALQSGGLMSQLGERFVKIGVGIGRPAGGSRSSEDVGRYVLGELSEREKDGIEGRVRELAEFLRGETVG